MEVWTSSPIFATTTDAALVSVRLHSSDSSTGKHSYEVRALGTGVPFSDVGVELLNPLTQQVCASLIFKRKNKSGCAYTHPL